MPKDMRGVMKEFQGGALHSGSSKGPVVKNRKQAIAIGLSEQRQQGKPVPPPHGGRPSLEALKNRPRG